MIPISPEACPPDAAYWIQLPDATQCLAWRGNPMSPHPWYILNSHLTRADSEITLISPMVRLDDAYTQVVTEIQLAPDGVTAYRERTLRTEIDRARAEVPKHPDAHRSEHRAFAASIINQFNALHGNDEESPVTPRELAGNLDTVSPRIAKAARTLFGKIGAEHDLIPGEPLDWEQVSDRAKAKLYAVARALDEAGMLTEGDESPS